MSAQWRQAIVLLCVALASACRRVECAGDAAVSLTCNDAMRGCDGRCDSGNDVVPPLADRSTIQPNDQPNVAPTDAPPGTTVQFTIETVRLPQSNFRCGVATAIPPSPSSGPQSLFVVDDWIYMSADGTTGRWNRQTGVAQFLTRSESGGPGFWGVLAAQGRRIAAVLNEPRGERPVGVNPRWAHFAVFDDPLLPGRLLWTHRFPEGIGGIIQEFVATTRMMAWVVKNAGSDYHLWISGPNGENPHEIEQLNPLPHQPTYLHADGPNLVWMFRGEIYLWNVDRGVVENLTNDAPWQWMPWIEGDRVVWVDQRDNPAGDLFRMDNPEIYLFDLRTRERRRITRDAPERPAQQRWPGISGDWIVWEDYRESQIPNPPDVLSDRTALWGYHIPTGREMPIVRGDFVINSPHIIGTEIFFHCVNFEQRAESGFVISVPAVADAGP